ncbi:MAG: hypothetical protein K8R46_03655 [Pirellulales bacterium]|nr:hypothetical protein [Pirellulales bacterium]
MSHRYKAILVFCLPCLLLFGFVSRSQADYRYWTGDTGNWSNASNWDVAEPISGDYVHIYNGGTALVTTSGEICYNLYLGDFGDGKSGAVEMTGGSLRSSRDIVGDQGIGTITQSDGNHHVIYSLTLGNSVEGVGNYTLSGGSLWIGHSDFPTRAAEEIIGSYGTGHFTQTGGSHFMYKRMVIGRYSGSTGTYDLQDGSLEVGSSECIGAAGGNGTFTQSGGSHLVNMTFVIGDYVGSTGNYNMTGGSLWVPS